MREKADMKDYTCTVRELITEKKRSRNNIVVLKKFITSTKALKNIGVCCPAFGTAAGLALVRFFLHHLQLTKTHLQLAFWLQLANLFSPCS